MVKLSHTKLRMKMLEQNWRQERLAEALNITDRHVRNLCYRDTDCSISLCYRISRVLCTPIEELLVVQDSDSDNSTI